MSKVTAKEELDILFNKKHKLETIEIIRKWKEFDALPEFKKYTLRKEWNEYYIQVRETVAYQIFQEQRKSLAIVRQHPNTSVAWENVQRIKDLADDARMIMQENDYELTEPSFTDPWELDYSNVVRMYKQVENRIKELMQNDGF